MTENVPSHKESWYQAKIIRWLKDNYPKAFIWKAAAGPYSRGGIPDICAIIGGCFFGFEVKRPGIGKLTKLQEQAIKQINDAGGFAAKVSYPADCKKMIEGEIGDGKQTDTGSDQRSGSDGGNGSRFL